MYKEIFPVPETLIADIVSDKTRMRGFVQKSFPVPGKSEFLSNYIFPYEHFENSELFYDHLFHFYIHRNT